MSCCPSCTAIDRVRAAAQGRDSFVDRTGGLGPVTDVRDDRTRVAALLDHPPNRLLRRVGDHIDCDGRPFARERESARPTDASAAAGEEGSLAVQVLRHDSDSLPKPYRRRALPRRIRS
ncbi:MAG: hypothetical protein QOI69_1748, partial [Pseudonocardiales bacterium]|nr:hypothetical protein [Pseudonocardiales bacterium]